MKPNCRVGIRLTIMVVAVAGLAGITLKSWPARASGPWYVALDGRDSNDCLSSSTPCATINGAIGKANFSDTVYVAVGVFTSSIGSEVVLINKSLTLSGGWNAAFTTQNGMTTIDGEKVRRGITTDSDVTTLIERFTVQNGYDQKMGGGGIHNSGTMTISHCNLNSNVAEVDTNYLGGGGIYNIGNLTLDNSSINNSASIYIYGDNVGGGIRNINGAITLNRSTISGNKGGGISNAGSWGPSLILNNSTVSGNTPSGIESYGTLALNNSTISDNGVGLDIWNVSPVLQNTILAGNNADCTGPVALGSLGYNLIGTSATCGLAPGTGDITNTSAKLGPLIGSPGYHPLLPASPAIDAGDPAGCAGSQGPLTEDQRGVSRSGRCDIGAYEYVLPDSPVSISAFGGTPQHTLPNARFEKRVRALVLDSLGTPVHNITITLSAPPSGPSGVFADSGSYTTTSVTGEDGIATAMTLTANSLTGEYTVTAQVSGIATPANFLLGNIGWYVAPGGSNSNDCHTPATPCASIMGALGNASLLSGDKILVASGLYTSTGNEVVRVDKNIILSGGWESAFTTQNGTSVIDGQKVRRGLLISSDATASLDGFAVQNGAANMGGGILNNGALILTDSIIADNTATSGGGVYIGYNGTMTVTNSLISRNTASSDGGGIYILQGRLDIINSTLSGNTAAGVGGGLYQDSFTVNIVNSTVSGNKARSGGGIYKWSGAGTLSNCTVSNNTSTEASGLGGGGIYNNDFYGALNLQNSILAGNTHAGSPNCSGQIASGGYNLIENITGCTFSASGSDLLNVPAPLFPLTGSPGYHILLPGNPATDGGNPSGCNDHLGQPIVTDQHGTIRPLDGNSDGLARCDIGSYELDPTNYPIRQAFLPVCAKRYCGSFFDDFSNSVSGWPIGEDSYVLTEYLNGEYRIFSKRTDYRLNTFRAPTCDFQNYIVEADARWEGTPGNGYGLVFGATSDFSQYYLFHIDAKHQTFILYRLTPGGLVSLVGTTYNSAISSGSTTNHLKVTRDGTLIELEVNGTTLGTWSDSAITGMTGMGLFSGPYNNTPNSDARFDNFRVINLLASALEVQTYRSITKEAGGSGIYSAYHIVPDSNPVQWLHER